MFIMEACFRDSSLGLKYICIRNDINIIRKKLNSKNTKQDSVNPEKQNDQILKSLQNIFDFTREAHQFLSDRNKR